MSAAGEYLSAAIATQHELGDVAGISQVLERFVELAAAQGQHDQALCLTAAATMLHERTGAPLTPSSRARLDRALEPARRALSAEAADAAWQAGSTLDLDQVVAAALAVTAPAPEQPAAPTPAVTPDVAAASVLTRREQEVATLIARGLTNRQIAEELVITEGTAANHVVHILGKLEFSSRAQVAVWAAEQGLLADQDRMTALPTGTVTFLFTDIEGSTRLLEARPEAYRAALARHDAIIRQAVAAHEGVVFQTRGRWLLRGVRQPDRGDRGPRSTAQRGLWHGPWGELRPTQGPDGLAHRRGRAPGTASISGRRCIVARA